MVEVYLLSVNQWLRSLTLAGAVLSNPGREVCFVDPQLMEQEIEALNILNARFSVSLIDATGSDAVATALSRANIPFRLSVLEESIKWKDLVEEFGRPRGLVAAPADSRSLCLKAAALAVRLGYYFLPFNDTFWDRGIMLEGIPLIWLGPRETLVGIAGDDAAGSFTSIHDDEELLGFLREAEMPADYLLILNSADLEKDTARGSCLGELWVKGLSLNAPALAAYRDIFIFDAESGAPEAEKIETAANEMINRIGLKPRFQAVLASPAAVPFFYEEKKAIGAVTEEMVRDIHVRLNDDLFFDLAEGRLMQNNPGGLSVQLISTRRYGEIKKSCRGRSWVIKR